MNLKTREMMRLCEGPVYGLLYGTGRVVVYEVVGLPPGQKASIRNFGNRNKESWRIRRTENGVNGEWTGNYPSVSDALKALSV